MKITVLGATGHVGGYLIPRLVELGHQVTAVSRGRQKPYRSHAAWEAVERESLDREALEVDGSFADKILALSPEIVIDMICFNADSARHLVKALNGVVQHYLACDDVRVTGVTVRSLVNHNNDGINIDSCRRVIISDCNIESGDDAVVLKSTSARVCRDVMVSNCVLSSRCNALKMGTESNGGFKNIVMTGCSIYDTRLAGVALEIVNGGVMEKAWYAELNPSPTQGTVGVTVMDVVVVTRDPGKEISVGRLWVSVYTRRLSTPGSS